MLKVQSSAMVGAAVWTTLCINLDDRKHFEHSLPFTNRTLLSTRWKLRELRSQEWAQKRSSLDLFVEIADHQFHNRLVKGMVDIVWTTHSDLSAANSLFSWTLKDTKYLRKCGFQMWTRAERYLMLSSLKPKGLLHLLTARSPRIAMHQLVRSLNISLEPLVAQNIT